MLFKGRLKEVMSSRPPLWGVGRSGGVERRRVRELVGSGRSRLDLMDPGKLEQTDGQVDEQVVQNRVSRKKSSFSVDSPLRGGRGLSTKEEIICLMFLF